jgi:hypothetical protein
LLAAFPPGTPIDRVTLDEAVAVVAATHRIVPEKAQIGARSDVGEQW